MAVVGEVAEATGREPTELTPLYRVLDPDALDALVAETGPDGAEVEFEYEGVTVSVRDEDGPTVVVTRD